MRQEPAVVLPARLGSTRVKVKNLRKLNGVTLIDNMIEVLQKTRTLKNIYINSDSDLFASVAKRNNVKFYHRKPELATSASLIDDYIYDFIKSVQPRYLAVVNPTSPFVSAETLEAAWQYFLDNNFDTLLSCEKIQTHCFYQNKPVNFSIQGKHPRSQDLEPVRALNFAITIWNCDSYLAHYEANQYGVYTGKIGFFDIEGFGGIDIDYEEDFQLAEFVARFLTNSEKFEAEYDELIAESVAEGVEFAN